MATESGAAPAAPGQHAQHDGVIDKGLKKGAIGYISNVVIGVASTAPAYSLAATLGFVAAVKGVGVHAPAVLLVAFVPMLLVASAYKYFNRADPDAGTTFAWTTRAVGPGLGWMNGWAIFLADVIVMASLSDIAAIYTFKLFGFSELGNSNAAIIVAAALWIVLMTWICYRGIELSARIQTILLGTEVAILGAFAVVALVKVYGGSAPHGAIKPTLDWFNPFAMKFGDLFVALLLAVFIYWGWDSGVAVNEESEDPAEGPGKAAVVSTILLLLIYVVVSASAQAFHGVGFITNEENSSDVLNALGTGVFGEPWNKLLIITVLTSASASTQTTILPTARTTLSMAHWKAVTSLLARVHKRYLTPTVSTLGFGALSIVVTVVLLLLSSSVLEASISAVGFPIVFYYGWTGIACAIYYRRELTKSVRNFLLLGVGPLLGGLILWAVGVRAMIYYGHAANNASKPILGISLPLWMGVGGLILGFFLMLLSRGVFKDYFSRKLETAPPGVLEHPLATIPPPVGFGET
ncbi:MAG TPA: APC family permease [Solirubrobacteraceae bacterium]|jgi:amino acid transporter|nr:APC family permease [Solirubrobacteraceae bacterium]